MMNILYKALLGHTGTYSLMFAVALSPLFGLITFVVHTATDAVTSQFTHHYGEKQDWHNFFFVVGLDQLLHYIQLTLTYHFLLRI